MKQIYGLNIQHFNKVVSFQQGFLKGISITIPVQKIKTEIMANLSSPALPPQRNNNNNNNHTTKGRCTLQAPILQKIQDIAAKIKINCPIFQSRSLFLRHSFPKRTKENSTKRK